MMAILKSILRSKHRKLSFMTTLVCLDCERLFDSSRTGRPCPYCASSATIPAANWSPIKYGMPRFDIKKLEISKGAA